MLILTKSVLVMMLGFIISIMIAMILIPALRRMKIKQELSIYLADTHRSKKGTPTMGGLIFIIPVIIVFLILFFTKKININYSIIIVLFTFIGYSLIGFIDDYLIIKRKNNKGLSESAKLLMQLVIATIFFTYLWAGNEPFYGFIL